MNDLEIVRACARAMRVNGIVECRHPLNIDIQPPAIWVRDNETPDGYFYNPLTNDAQAFALIRNYPHDCETVLDDYAHGNEAERKRNLNHAICECVAKMERP